MLISETIFLRTKISVFKAIVYPYNQSIIHWFRSLPDITSNTVDVTLWLDELSNTSLWALVLINKVKDLCERKGLKIALAYTCKIKLRWVK